MATYKVPQDVEADDKILGPFSPRQLVYLFIVVMAGALAWGLSKIFIGLALIPVPIILLFGALALPLRKDQPMETYLAAMVSFFLKPRVRKWEADGIDSIIEITAPKIVEIARTKDITRTEAEKRLGYLAEIVDSQGWAVRGAGITAPNNAMITDAYFEAQQAQDVMDFNNATAQSFDRKLTQTEAKRHQAAIDLMNNKNQASAYTIPSTPATANIPVASAVITPNNNPQSPKQPEPITDLEKEMEKEINFNPYPEEMQQSILQPINLEKHPIDSHHQTNNHHNHNKTESQTIVSSVPQSTSEKPISADIINLASNTDLSIEAIAHEAGRIHKKQDISEEVVISLR